MKKTLEISFSLKNAYRVNTILYSLKQIPFIKKILPAELYRARGLKAFANVLSVLWEILSVFVGKLLYFLTLVCGVGALYKTLPEGAVFLHILLFLTIVGCVTNTGMFNPSKDKYYAIFLMRMDAREYALTGYMYYILKVIIGFLPFTILFGSVREIPLWLCILLPFGIAGMKMFSAAISLWNYEKHGTAFSESQLSIFHWALIGILLAAAYVIPYIGYILPASVSAAGFLLCIPLGFLGFYKVFTFREYTSMCKEILRDVPYLTAAASQAVKKENENKISADPIMGSHKTGFEYLNELFIQRHKKILWSSAENITKVCVFLIAGLQVAMAVMPELRLMVNVSVMVVLPYFTFIMYCLNRGTGFTQALFMNCDHSLLTYAFYKQPNYILQLFRIRLREIMKINAVPALVIGAGLALSLYTSGGTDAPLNYAVLIVSIVCMSLFFSVHYLTIYYLLQPYTAGTELKSGTYRIVTGGTYLLCFFLMQQQISIIMFGIMTILFVVLYCILAGVLIYRLAPKTFKIRM